jgi:uncharacterized protein with von Willebrand factor type A (vWA) domain
MGSDDLLRMLDLDGGDAPGADAVLFDGAGPGAPARTHNPNAIDLDEWGARRGRELVEATPALGVDEHAAADFHAAAFEPDPRLLPACSDPARHQFLSGLFDTPEYRELHASTQLNEVASEIATAHFCRSFAALKRERGEDPRDPAPGSIEADLAVARAVGRAVEAAAGEVDEAAEAAAAMGYGPGAPGSNDPAAIAAIYRRVRSDPALRRVVELAGRFRRVAQSRQRTKAVHGQDDLVGVGLGGEVARLVPSELARLAFGPTRLDTLRKVAERNAHVYEFRAAEPVGKGPVIIAVDESGSMHGEKGHAAKALGLAMAWVAMRQRRWCALVAYSGDSGERVLVLPPSRRDEAALMGWLSEFIGGGSDVDVPVREMPRMYRDMKAPEGKTDMVWVTDAICRIPAPVREAFLAWKAQARCKLTTLVIGSNPGDLEAVSDETHRIPGLAVDGEAVGRVLSL